MLTAQQECTLDEIGACMSNWLQMLRAQKAKPGHVQTQTDEIITYNMEIVIGDLLKLKQDMRGPVPTVDDTREYHDYCLSLLTNVDMAVSALSHKLDTERGETHKRSLAVNDTLTALSGVRRNWMK